MSFVRFSDKQTAEPVFVNPRQVRAVRAGGFSGATLIIFDHAHNVAVSEKPEAVVKALDDAASS